MDATERFLSDLEHGKKRKPSAAYLYRISQALGVSMEILMQEIPDGDEQQDHLPLVTKRLYPEVARHFQMDWKHVERNIRTVVAVIWQKNPSLLESYAHRPLLCRPRNTEFLAILS